MISLNVDFVSQLNHNTDNPLWIFLLVQLHFTTSIYKIIIIWKNSYILKIILFKS